MCVNIYHQFTRYILLINEKEFQLLFYSKVYIQFHHSNYKEGKDLTIHKIFVFISEKVC